MTSFQAPTCQQRFWLLVESGPVVSGRSQDNLGRESLLFSEFFPADHPQASGRPNAMNGTKQFDYSWECTGTPPFVVAKPRCDGLANTSFAFAFILQKKKALSGQADCDTEQ